jgi:predicted nuclease of predicted toxin-antitoxin system
VRFLIDRCAGQLLSKWLREQGHDVLDARDLGPDPGDRALLERAAAETRILVTIDTDFGELIYVSRIPHAGLVRLPDVPADRRIALIAELLGRHRDALDARAVVTIRGDRVRISHPPPYGDAH